MLETFRTEQEAFWAGEFGQDYTHRNEDDRAVERNVALFARILSRAPGVRSVIELGANLGLNLRAIRRLIPDAELAAVEINRYAAERLEEIDGLQIHRRSLLEFESEQTFDLALIKGVLIHIAPDSLPRAYRALYDASHRYVCLAEYYNPTPVEVSYRGHAGRLFKRDFAGEMLDQFPDLRLVDYGFIYHRDVFPQDDLTWFLLEKHSA
jgi:spore coat polysaccharide biosynthesis protein SpsF